MNKRKWQRRRTDGTPMSEEYRLENVKALEEALGRKATTQELILHRLQPDHLVPR